ncbi:PREDICTED: uncharacterized protein LOC105459770 isoform X2 [Wasmannia auropunctata]|uniref:uncharacterized protein LOC105459770 isoform X2 n=1 Tax=Wasmannia auropunctata TaxID=64793 RepID=UPI0005EF5639|nr:PREDICTED: uncharacterized protein LOC105459770 isoform X2 [Wasmannia auropunctata]
MTMMKIYVIPILIYYFNNISLALFPSNLLTKHEELRKKINKAFNFKYGEILLNVDEYEYPRSNETLRQLHKQQWLDYYKCLEKIYADMKNDKITYPSALIALEGTSVILKCQICISPMEMRVTSLIEWYFNSSSNKSNSAKSTLQNRDHIVNSPDNRYIIIYNVKLEEAGTYWCEVGDTIGSVYYLHVESNLETNVIVHSYRASYALQAVENVPEYKLKVYTTWTTWTPCSMCDEVGIKLRYGYCTVALSEMLEHGSFIEESAINKLRHAKRDIRKAKRNQTHEGMTQMEAINATLKVQLKTALMLFKNKLPCKSRLLPEQKKCRKNIIFEVRDEKGNILESANNSAGIFSMIQGMPEPLPSIARSVVYEKHDKKIKLLCPGNLNADIPIVWRVDDKTINPSHIKFQSNGRIHINPQMQIIFESLKFDDANIYSCWQNNEIAGVIKLNVIGEIEFKLNYHVILIGAIVIISVVLIMFWRAFKGRTRYTMH